MTSKRLAASRDITVEGVPLKLDMNMIGIASLHDFKGSKLEESVHRPLPRACSLVVFAMEVYPEILEPTRAGRQMGEAIYSDIAQNWLIWKSTESFSQFMAIL